MREQWEDIKGYDGVYQVSNLGRVKSIDHFDCNKRNRIKGRILKPAIKRNGYLQIALSDRTGKSKNYYVHKLVAEAFIGNCPKDCEVNHIDENKANNNVLNLEYVSHRININHGTNLLRSAQKRRKPVLQFEKGGEYIAEFSSTIEAEKETGVWHNNISKVCKGKAKTAGGFIWRYKWIEKQQ